MYIKMNKQDMTIFDRLHAWKLFKKQCINECKQKKCCLIKIIDEKFILKEQDCVSQCIDREFYKIMEIHSNR